ncbi:MAG TPA: hypothetical protein PLJ35_03635 [Anaerolineae bacterium]|nr:hypothetical protein [Anaerolineae bacterium]HOQ97894.1 hypothetical protein [Anaerolineae bacterium]HPL26712.1 hypothetical protein [Anaerolineae bacterium]
MKTRNILVIAAVACALVLGGLWLLQFRMLRSHTVEEHTIATFSTGSNEASTRRGVGVDLVVAGQGALAQQLRRALVAQLEATPAFGQVTLLDSAPERAAGFGLIVELAEPQLLWTPVYARATSTAKVTFSMDGNLSWCDQAAVAMQPGDGPWVRGEVRLTDTSWGLSTLPGYRRLLAESLAAGIVKGLTGVVNGS